MLQIVEALDSRSFKNSTYSSTCSDAYQEPDIMSLIARKLPKSKVGMHTVCPGSSDPPEKYSNLFASEK